MNATGHEHSRDDLAAYLLGALEPGEAAAVERHLAGCEECRTELEWLRPAVGVLPESVERVEPAPRLRQSLMEQVRAEAEGASASPKRERRWGLGGWGLRPLAGLAAVVLVVAAVAAYAIGTSDSGSGGETTTVSSGRAPGVTAELVSEGESGTLHLAHLHQLPPDEVLQAWVERDGKVESAKTLFIPNQDGTASATIDDMTGVTTVMVTAEPRGGSVQPTSAPIASVSMKQ
ncbi:MAG TPA: anti-sigma factor [Solirubrobacterales bacterium]|nr:anti-sigma factor [Solirubrobacterales bacterium]